MNAERMVALVFALEGKPGIHVDTALDADTIPITWTYEHCPFPGRVGMDEGMWWLRLQYRIGELEAARLRDEIRIINRSESCKMGDEIVFQLKVHESAGNIEFMIIGVKAWLRPNAQMNIEASEFVQAFIAFATSTMPTFLNAGSV